jgi:hypothetical protein
MNDPGYPACELYNITQVEINFVATKLAQAFLRAPILEIRRLVRPALVDGPLDGTYCARYNHMVRSRNTVLNEPLPGGDELLLKEELNFKASNQLQRPTAGPSTPATPASSSPTA